MTDDSGHVGEGPLRSEWRIVDGCRWHARVSVNRVAAGEPPIVLVHGLGVSNRYMMPTARRLAPRFPVFAPDLPGFGSSERPNRVLSVSELAGSLARWLQAMALERAVLLGNSLGCQIIVDLAIRYPERVGWVVLVGPTGDPAAASLLRQFGRLLLDIPREPLLLDLIQAWAYLRAGPRRTFHTARAMVRDPIEAKLPLVRQPALVVRGGRDPIVPQRWAEEVTRLLPRGRLVVVPGAAHAVNYNAPTALVDAVCDFLASDMPDHRDPRKRGRHAAG